MPATAESERALASKENVSQLHDIDSSQQLDRLRCPICLDTVRDATFTGGEPCQHFFCKNCITKALTRQMSCPVCKQSMSIDALRPHLFVQEHVGDVVEPCRFVGHGCKWRGRNDALQGHLGECVGKRLHEFQCAWEELGLAHVFIEKVFSRLVANSNAKCLARPTLWREKLMEFDATEYKDAWSQILQRAFEGHLARQLQEGFIKHGTKDGISTLRKCWNRPDAALQVVRPTDHLSRAFSKWERVFHGIVGRIVTQVAESSDEITSGALKRRVESLEESLEMAGGRLLRIGRTTRHRQ